MEAGNEKLANMVILGALVEKSRVVSLKSLKKALYPALDVRYHKMIPANRAAMDKGSEFIRNLE
jgi:2-oxoglutarate ferredoxin oxidoreductase subunit gamma